MTGMEIVSAALTGLSAISQIGTAASAAQTQQNMENYNATIARQNANAANAQASAKASDTALTTQYQLSRARAAAAASGGNPDSVSTENIESTIAGRGEYNVLSDIYQGQTTAKSFTDQANLDTWQGQQAQRAVLPSAVGTILRTGSTMYDTYGDGGPSAIDQNAVGGAYFASASNNPNYPLTQ